MCEWLMEDSRQLEPDWEAASTFRKLSSARHRPHGAPRLTAVQATAPQAKALAQRTPSPGARGETHGQNATVSRIIVQILAFLILCYTFQCTGPGITEKIKEAL